MKSGELSARQVKSAATEPVRRNAPGPLKLYIYSILLYAYKMYLDTAPSLVPRGVAGLKTPAA